MDNFNNTIQKLDDANETIFKLDSELTLTEKELTKTKNELNNVKRNLSIEKKIKEEYQEKSNEFEIELKQKIQELNEMNNDIINLKENLDIFNQNKIQYENDINKYKEHILFLTKINQQLLNELDLVSERDQQLKDVLTEHDEIPDFINNIKKDMESALNDLEIGLNSKE